MAPIDDALDRLAGDLRSHADVYTYLDRDKDAAAVRSELQRLREELRVTTNERDELYEANWPWEWVIATREKERRQAAEAEVQRLTEKNEKLSALIAERDNALRLAGSDYEECATERDIARERAEAAEAEADKYRKATDQQARRAESAEAENRRLDELRALYLSEADRWSEEARRLTEGLRERDELLARILDHGAAGYAEHQARRSAWVSRSDSPEDRRLEQFEAAIGREATTYERAMLSPSDGGGAK